ncbi:type IV secretion system protein VirB4 [Variovorax sp. 770b2]|nr:type IV secretion system protein VirB4 [Variovorax sp. 770b2]
MLRNTLKRIPAAEDYVPPYRFHLTNSIVNLADERCMFVVRCRGTPFEAVSDGMLDNSFDALNAMALNLGKSVGGRLGVWCHLDHYQTKFEADYQFEFDWLRQFSKSYLDKFANAAVFENCFYMSFVLKPGSNDTLSECVRELEEVQLHVTQSLRSYDCEVLRSYERNGQLFSETYEFIGYLNNGFWERIPVTAQPLSSAVQSSSLHHGYKLIETRSPDGSRRFGAYFDLKDFPSPTRRGMLIPLLDLRFPFLLTMSFCFIEQAGALKMIAATENKLLSAGDKAVGQLEEMSEGEGAIQAGEIFFGELHASIAVYGATEKQTEERGSTARTTLSASCGSLFVPATLSAPETFFGQFPGNVKRRSRPMPKTTRNLVGMFGMNAYSSGKQHGNPIGDGTALMPLFTPAKGVYHLNCHYSIPDQDEIGQKRAGHTVITGATGVGKTTVQTTILGFVSRFDAKMFGLDKDGSMRGLFEALGGTYFKLESGMPTGLAPFQLENTAENRNFLYDLVAACGRRMGEELAAEDTKDIKRAVDNVLELDFADRRFGAVLQSIPDRGKDCLRKRLEDWCYGDVEGRYAYALDNERNEFDWDNFKRVAFDVSDFLVDGHPATEPILAYLLHLKKILQKQRGVLATIIEEFWLPLKYRTTCEQILEILKVGRRRDEFAILVTQSPADASQSPILPAILEQTATKIYLANPDAEYDPPSGTGGYIRFNVTPKEFARIKSFGKESRLALIKQGGQSAVVHLDLTGQEEDIAVLAMAKDDFPLLEKAQSDVGRHPDAWVPAFKKLRREFRAQAKRAAPATSIIKGT